MKGAGRLHFKADSFSDVFLTKHKKFAKIYINLIKTKKMKNLVEKQPGTHELQVSKLHEAIDAASHVTVEFGTGDTPLFELQTEHSFNANNLYVGVNLDSKQHKHLAAKTEAINGFAVLSEKNEHGTIDQLPIPNGSVDMVFMANVFGEPDSEHIMEQFKGIDGLYKGNSDIDSKTETLNVAKRLLKDGGRIVILENNTPYQAGFSGDYDSMVQLLRDSGFDTITAINQKDEDWGELVTQFAKPVEWWSYGSYLVIAQKSEP